LLYLLLEPDGFRCLYAVRVDPARGVVVSNAHRGSTCRSAGRCKQI